MSLLVFYSSILCLVNYHNVKKLGKFTDFAVLVVSNFFDRNS